MGWIRITHLSVRPPTQLRFDPGSIRLKESGIKGTTECESVPFCPRFGRTTTKAAATTTSSSSPPTTTATTMASVMNEAIDQDFAAKIQELREEAARSFRLEVGIEIRLRDKIQIVCHFRAEAHHSKEVNIRALPNSEQVLAAIGDILAQDHAQLRHFLLSRLNCQDNGYPQFWRGLAANRVLKEVRFVQLKFPDEPVATRFLANPALESLELQSCIFSHGTFESFCQGIQSSHIKKLEVGFCRLPPRVSSSLLWSALEHGDKVRSRLLT